MNKLCAIITATLLAQFVFAQDNVKGKYKDITLKKYDGEDYTTLAMPIAKIEVVTSLWDNNSIGYVQIGLGNKKVKAKFSAESQTCLQQLISEQYQHIYNTKGRQLLFVIKDIRIGERTFSLAERGFVRLQADAYILHKDSLFAFACNIDTVLQIGGMDVTKKHGKLIAEALDLLLQKTTHAFSAVDTSYLLSKSNIVERTNGRMQSSIIVDSTYTIGMYRNFREFLHNNPSIHNYAIEQKDGKIQAYILDDSNHLKTPIRNFWGICNLNEIYVHYSNTLIPIEKEDHLFILSNYLENVKRKNKAKFWGSIISGAVGGFVGGAIIGAATAEYSENLIYSVTTIPYITERQPEATAIDMNTGELSF